MQPARFRQEDFLLVEINNAESTRPAVSSGEELPSFVRIKKSRWWPVEHLRYHGQIADCEQSNPRMSSKNIEIYNLGQHLFALLS